MQFHINKNIEVLFKIIITFGLVFDVSFADIPLMSTGRFSLLVLFVTNWRALVEIKILKKFFALGLISLMIIVYALLAVVLNGFEDTILLSRAFWFFVYAVVATILYSKMCGRNLEKMLSYFFGAVLIQATFVYWSAISADFRLWTSLNLKNSGNLVFTEVVRFSGISNSGGALLSLQLSIGIIAAYVLFRQSPTKISRLRYLIAIMYITLSTVLVGRTGLYVCLLILVLLFFAERKKLLMYILAVIIFYSVSILFSGIQVDEIDYSSDQFQVSRTLIWAFDIFMSGESASLQDLMNSSTREISALELLFGSGRVFDEQFGNYSGSDSGYLQTIFAAGLPVALLFYFSIAHFGVTNLMRSAGVNKATAMLLLILLFVLELKEPFIHKYSIAFFSILFWHLANDQIKQSKEIFQKNIYDNPVF